MITQLKNTPAKSSKVNFSLFTTSEHKVVTAVTTASKRAHEEWERTDSVQSAHNVAAK
jgi:hypothetical protein